MTIVSLKPLADQVIKSVMHGVDKEGKVAG
jgi:hypothetical protein